MLKALRRDNCQQRQVPATARSSTNHADATDGGPRGGTAGNAGAATTHGLSRPASSKGVGRTALEVPAAVYMGDEAPMQLTEPG